MGKKIETGTLMTRACAKLKADKRSLLEISESSGINYYWLKKFAQGEFDNPSVNTVQCLWEYLSEKPLQLL